MKDIKETFSKIRSHEDLAKFVLQHSLNESSSESPQILGIYSGEIDGNSLRVTHRWYDRSKLFSIQPDGNEIKIEVIDHSGNCIFTDSVKYNQD